MRMLLNVGCLSLVMRVLLIMPSTVDCFLVPPPTHPTATFVITGRREANSNPPPSWLYQQSPSTIRSPCITTTGRRGVSLMAASPSLSSVDSSSLMTFFLQTLIAYGVPAVLTVVVIGFAAVFWSDNKDEDASSSSSFLSTNSPLSTLYDDVYGDQQQQQQSQQSSFSFLKFNRRNKSKQQQLAQNTGIPKQQYLKITHWNPQLDSYRYSLQVATDSKAAAAAQYRVSAWNRVWRKTTTSHNTLQPHQVQQLLNTEQTILQQAAEKQKELARLQTSLLASTLEQEYKTMGIIGTNAMNASIYSVLDPAPLPASNSSSLTNATSTALANATTAENTTATLKDTASSIKKKKSKSSTADSKKKKEMATRIVTLQAELLALQFEMVKQVVSIVGPEQAPLLTTALLGSGGDLSSLLSGTERPLTKLLNSNEQRRPRVFVLRFPGDPTASQVETLRQEITALLLLQPTAGDQVVVVLQTGGGTVTGYGLAAAQLLRLKNAGLYLTICVEQVAASGGYMMACVADKIVASPFAVLGSIGVITDIPNVYERLKQEGIEFQTVTAGKYKRTLTPTKKVVKEDLAKTKVELEEVLTLFRDFVADNRPSLDIDRVATGETWFGQDALDMNLCDELRTVDETLLDLVDQGCDVFEVAYKPPFESPFADFLSSASTSTSEGKVESAIRWLARRVIRVFVSELATTAESPLPTKPLEEQYMALDDIGDRIKSQR